MKDAGDIKRRGSGRPADKTAAERTGTMNRLLEASTAHCLTSKDRFDADRTSIDLMADGVRVS